MWCFALKFSKYNLNLTFIDVNVIVISYGKTWTTFNRFHCTLRTFLTDVLVSSASMFVFCPHMSWWATQNFQLLLTFYTSTKTRTWDYLNWYNIGNGLYCLLHDRGQTILIQQNCMPDSILVTQTRVRTEPWGTPWCLFTREILYLQWPPLA